MFLIDLSFAVIVALVLVFLLGIALGYSGPWGSAALFFLVLVLTTWAVAVWLPPFGPALYGSYWLAYVVVGILVALLLIAAVPPHEKRRHPEGGKRVEQAPEGTLEHGMETRGDPEPATARMVLGAFFWLLLAALVIAIAAAYLL